MLAQICEFLAVDSRKFPLNESVVIGDTSSQGSFMIHYFLNLCRKQDRPVLFLGLSQSFNYYSSVAQKLGNNLLSARFSNSDDNKNLIFVEGLQLITECASSEADAALKHNPFFSLLQGNSSQILELIISSLETLEQVQEKQQNKEGKQTSLEQECMSPVVIIDDLSVLQSAGVSPKEILLFVNQVQEIITARPTKGSLVILYNFNQEDEKSSEIWHFLTHLSTLQVDVTGLQSGYCRDVHGQLQIQWRDSQTQPRKLVKSLSQFKLSDKNIELFASGMSAAVL